MGWKSFILLDYNTVLEAHHSILHQLLIIEPLIEQHLNELHEQNNGHIEDWVMKEHMRTFTTWLQDQNILDGETMEEQTIKKLASGPSRQITTWQTYDINGFMFCVNLKDKKSVAQNSGIHCGSLDENCEYITYYGFVHKI
jgi:hypothetical protein